jgi:hypothetical protein
MTPPLDSLQAQHWAYAQKAIFQDPRPDLRSVSGTVAFVRDQPMICPWCQDVFFGYRREDRPIQQCFEDREPRAGMGMRLTCGHPKCHEAEDDHQWRRRRAFRGEIPYFGVDVPLERTLG